MITFSGSFSFRGTGLEVYERKYVIPANSVILYNGTYTQPVDGWELYTDAIGNLIVGSNTQAEIGVVTAASGQTDATSGTIGTAGAHLGGTIITFSSGGGSRAAYRDYGGTAGGHTHTNTWDKDTDTLSTDIKPHHTTYTLLKTSQDRLVFPPGTVHIAETNIYNTTTQEIAPNFPRYIVAGARKNHANANSHSFTFTTYAESVSHSHFAAPQDEYTSSAIFGSLRSYYNYSAYFPAHTHTLTRTATISDVKGKLLKLWSSASSLVPANTTVIMYAGDIAALPNYWKVCDGQNGTVDMRDYFLGYANSSVTSHATVTAVSTQYTYSSPVTTATTGYQHWHYSAASDYYYTKNASHANETISHAHAVSGGTISSTYEPSRIKLAFIQFNKSI